MPKRETLKADSAHLDFFHASSPPDDKPSGYAYKGG
jgi:hypothetical protein